MRWDPARGWCLGERWGDTVQEEEGVHSRRSCMCARMGGPERVRCSWRAVGIGGFLGGEVGGGPAKCLWPYGEGHSENIGVHAKGYRKRHVFSNLACLNYAVKTSTNSLLRPPPCSI